MNLHKDAETNFNKKADEFLLNLAPEKEEVRTTKFNPDVFVAHHLTEKDIIGEIRMGKVNYLGEEVAKYFNYNGRQIGLEDEEFQKVVKLAEDIQRNKEFYSLVSINFLKDKIFKWMEKKYKNTTALSMINFIKTEINGSVRELEIWIPIALLHTQTDFKVGRITFKTISGKMFEKWIETGCQADQGNAQKIRDFYFKERKRLQGLAAATIELKAEPVRAVEIAMEETEKALNILRLFSMAILMPNVVSYNEILDKRNVPGYKSFILSNDSLFQYNVGFKKENADKWIIDDQFLNQFKQGGIDLCGQLITKQDLTSFEKTLIESLFTYSKSCTKEDLSDRLLYILTALETMFIKNTNEPIQDNLSERIAFLIGKNIRERKEIIQNLKHVYKLRSQFVHHGKSVKDKKELEIFLYNVWNVFHTLVLNTNLFKSKDHLLECLEERRLA